MSSDRSLEQLASLHREIEAARFAEYFKRDPSAQSRFLSTMQAAISRVRAERDRTPTG